MIPAFLRKWFTVKEPGVVIHQVEIVTLESKLTPDEEDRFTHIVLQNKDARELLERILLWKIGVITREAMNSADDNETRSLKKAAKKIGELTLDFKHLWERSKEREIKAEQESLSKIQP